VRIRDASGRIQGYLAGVPEVPGVPARGGGMPRVRRGGGMMGGLIQFFCERCERLWNYPKGAKRARKVCDECRRSGAHARKAKAMEYVATLERDNAELRARVNELLGLKPDPIKMEVG